MTVSITPRNLRLLTIHSNYFNGSTDYHSWAGYSALNFANSDFTIEFWINFNAMPAAGDSWPTNSTNNASVVCSGTTNLGDGVGAIIGATKLFMHNNNDAQYISTVTHGIVAGRWYHVAYVRIGGDLDIAMLGNAKVSTSVVKYSKSITFDGTIGTYCRIAPTPLLDFKTGNFTVEMWVNRTGVSGSGNSHLIRTIDGVGVSSLSIEIDPSNTLGLYMSSNGSSWDVSNKQYSTTISINTWYHIALVRNSNNIILFVNGTSICTITSSASLSYNTALNYTVIGGSNYSINYQFIGYIEDFRITRLARYTSNFTPPTASL
jgi:Concanavalin A-like lectin/glucanases superfamily